MIKKIIFSLSGCIFLLHTACAGDSTRTFLTDLKPEQQHQISFQTAVQMISAYHYSRPRIDDDFSSKAFDNYLKTLDPARVYFLESDIKSFERKRNSIDDDIMSGDPNFGFEMFNVYRTRLHDRIDYALSILKDSFDFSQQDSFEIDRENAAWCKDYKELDKLWKEKIKYECLALAASGKNFSSYSEIVRKRYENLLKFSNKTKSEDVFQLYMNSITTIADPHTDYFSPRSAEDFKQQMSLSLEGIGAQLRTENEYTKVNEIIKGGPADKSKKLHAGDKIVGVGQGKDSDIVNVVDWRIDDVVSLIRGKKGTLVRLEIIPAKEPNKTKIIELVRDKIVLEEQSAKSSVREIKRNGKTYKVGIINLPTFYYDYAGAQRGDENYKSTTKDVKKLIGELQKQKVSGIIMDLRTNVGGSLKEAVDLTGLFIKSGPVVQVKDGMENVRQEVDKDGEVFYDGPLVVLVNRFSASASEIFAAAIQDYHRGLVIGEKTFGKGTVQDIVDMNNWIQAPNGKKVGQIKLTIAKFYRVNGGTTQHNGVIPDVLLPGIYDDPRFGEDASPYALPWDQIASAYYDKTHPELNIQQLTSLASERIKKDKQYPYLMEEINNLKKLDERKFQTLNIKKWKEESEMQDQWKKHRDEEFVQEENKVNGAPDFILKIGIESVIDISQK